MKLIAENQRCVASVPLMKLVVVESPAKCSKIAGFLGADYKVLASMGHIRTLEEGLDAIGLDRDFEPKFTFMTEKAKAIAALKEAAAEASEVILAADDDREGEAIAYSVALLLKLPLKTTKRAIFHEITKTAVCKAVAEPRLLDMDRVYAQQARAMLDMMIGFTISPLLWKHVARGLSAGRCQTPALRFVVDREDEVAAHSAETSWIVRGSWSTGSKGATLDATLNEEIGDEESATNYLENMLEVNEATILTTQVKPWTEHPPPPLITSTLQQSASSLFHSNPKNTMRVAQRLYEAGHITYMRTDKAVLCAEAIVEAQGLVTSKYGPEYVGFTAASAAEEPAKKAKKATKAAKADAEEPKAQEAHEAIRPTHFDLEVLAGDEWTPLDRNIYKLIRSRALQTVMAPARGDSITIKLLPEGEDEDMFWSSTARRTTFQGWRIIGAKPVNDDEEDSDTDAADGFTTLTSLKVGDKVRWTSLETQPHITKAAPRYTEATLVKALEQRGIGRPSTFASLLDAIMERAYVEKKNIEGQKVTLNKYSVTPGTKVAKQTFTRALGAEKDRLVPTELGRQMLAFALKHFADLFDYGYTAGLETRLDHVSEGKEPWKSVLKETWTSYKDRVTALSTIAGASAGGQSKDTVKDLGGGLKAQVTKKGPLLIQESAKEGEKATFHGWPTGVSFADMTAEVARDFIAKKTSSVPVVGQYEGADITLHKGQYGHYVKYKEYNVSVKAEDPLETIIEKLKAKIGGSGSKVVPSKVGPFTFSTGPYGPYMYKTDLKTKKFVSVPAGIDISKLTVREADEIYKKGLEEKEAKAKAGAKFAAISAAKGRAY